MKTKKSMSGPKSGSFKQSISVVADDLLKLHYLPGASGAGRISTTQKAGLAYRKSLTYPKLYHGLITDQFMVAKVGFCPTVGSLWSTEDQSGVYAAIFRYYTYIRSKNVSISSYGVFDIFKALYSVSQLFMVMAHIRQSIRVCSICGSGVNSALPRGLVDAFGITAYDLQHVADNIASYNRIINAMRGLFLPFDFEIGKRSVALAGTIYLDDPMIDKSQFIVMHPYYYYKWDLNPLSPTVGNLVLNAFPAGPIESQLSTISQLVDLYLADADMNNIFAELRRAFGDKEQLKLALISEEGEPLTVEFSQVLLDQLHNATLVGDIDTNSALIQEDTSTGNIVYSGTYIKCNPYSGDGSVYTLREAHNPNTVFGPAPLHTERGFAQGYTYLYCHDNQPDEENIGTLLYFKARVGVGFSFPNSPAPIYSHGTEVLTTVMLYNNTDLWDQDGSVDPSWPDINAVHPFTTFYGVNASTVLNPNVSAIVAGIQKYRSFNYLPVFEVCISDTEGTIDGLCFLVEGDLDNRVEIDWAVVGRNISATTQFVIGHTFGL